MASPIPFYSPETRTSSTKKSPEPLAPPRPVANNLNYWPTSFFIGRDGRIREIHVGFAGPADPAAHLVLEHNVTALVEQLLAEPIPTHNASLSQ